MARRRIGQALEGFMQGFMPTYFQMQEQGRRNLADRQRYLRDAREGIREGYLTADDLDPYIAELESTYDMTPEESRTALGPFLRTQQERVGQVFKGQDLTRVAPVTMERLAQQYGVDLPQMKARRALETTPMPAFQPQDPTGKLLAPITLPYQGERTFVPEATGGTLEELTPFGEQFETEQAAALESEKDAAARALTYETDTLRKRLGVEQEVMAEWFGENTLREVDRARALGDVETNQMLERQAEGLQLAYKDDLLRLDDQGEFAKAMFAQEEKLAKMRALVSDQPVIYDRLLPNGEVATVMLHRGATGQFKFSQMGATLPGSPYSAYAASEILDPLNQILRGRSAQGRDVNLSNPETHSQVLAAARDMGIPDEAVTGLQEEQIRVRNDPTLDGLPQDVTDDIYGGDLGDYTPSGTPLYGSGESPLQFEVSTGSTVLPGQKMRIGSQQMMDIDTKETIGKITEAQEALQILVPKLAQVDSLPAGIREQRRQELLAEQQRLQQSVAANEKYLSQIFPYHLTGIESKPAGQGVGQLFRSLTVPQR